MYSKSLAFVVGIYIPESKHYYYTGFRKGTRFPAAKKTIMDNLELIREIDEEERRTVRESKSRECGYTGLSILHRLYPLYGFLYDQDLVFDEMHGFSLNVVKRAVISLKEDDEHEIDWSVVDHNLDNIPWTAGTTLA